MKRKYKAFHPAGFALLFALVILCVQIFATKDVKAAGSVLTSGDGLWKYECVEETSGETVAVVDGYNGSERNLVIPEEIDGYEVRYVGRQSGWTTSISADRFDSIMIPDSVTGLKNVPFFSPSHNLKFLYLGKNYGTYSRYGADINMIKANDTYDIQVGEFRVSPANEVIAAVDGVLYSKDLTELKLYPSLKEDAAYTVPDGVTSIGNDAMNNLQYLESLVLPDGLEEIGTYCCNGSSIRSVRLPNSLTSLNHGVFYKSKLESVVLPETITEIGGYVFTGAPLEEAVIPDTVVSLGAGAFMDCDRLKSIEIGSGLASIGGNCFYGLTSLETFRISEENQNFKSEAGMLLTKDGSMLIQYAAGNAEFILPAGVTEIGPKACYEMPFTEITIPDTVVSIGDNAFENCANAETAYIPSSVTSFGSGVFDGCASLKKATIDAKVARIGSVFSGCRALTEITLPETVTSIGDSIFFCESLRSLYLKPSQAPSISYTFYLQGQDAMAEMIKAGGNVRIFVPEDAQGYDALPWSRMHVMYGEAVVAERLTLNPSSMVLNVGEMKTIRIVAFPEDAVMQDAVWETSDKEIASVDENGRVKALSAGTAKIKVTAGGLSTECVITVRGDLPSRDFCVKTSGGTASGNYNAQNYAKWSSPVKSYLFEDGEGRLTRVEFINGKLVYETYDMDGKLKESGNIAGELPLFGGFYASGACRFVVYGQSNSGGSDSVEVMRVVKYDRDWKRISSCSLYGENTKAPFDAGSLRFAEHGNTLYIRTSHTMYNGHQANLQAAVDMSSMEITDKFSRVANIDSGGYVSHSFNQFLQTDGEDLIALDHGDAYPRAAVLVKYPNIQGTTFAGASVEHFNALSFSGMTGDNNTGASLGGLEVSEHYYIFAGNYANGGSSSVRNIFVSITDKDFLKNPDTRMIYLTDFGAGSGVTVSTPQLVKVNEKTFLVLWNETDASGTTVHSQMIDEDGNKVTGEKSFRGSLSDCRPIVLDGQAVWYYTGTKNGNTAPVFCRISVDGRDTTDNLKEGEADQEKDSGKEENAPGGNAEGSGGEKNNGTVKKGTSCRVGACQYKVTGTSAVSMTEVKDDKITKLKVPKTVKIGGKTFKVTAIGSGACKNNKKITSVEIGDNVKTIGASAFAGCAMLRKASLGKGVTEIGGSAFKNCRKLGNVTIKTVKLKKVGKNALKGIRSTAKVKVPVKKLPAYKKLFRNKGQGKKVKFVK